MIWENLTIDEFNEAVEKSKGVVLVPFGCLEKHGSHMPIGTDILVARYMSIKTSEFEPVMQPSSTNQIITLSTCSNYGDTLRTIVQAYYIDKKPR